VLANTVLSKLVRLIKACYGCISASETLVQAAEEILPDEEHVSPPATCAKGSQTLRKEGLPKEE